MPIPRFYFPSPLQPNLTVALPEALAHYATRVLRLKDGADVVLFDGHGGEYPARLHIKGKKAEATTGAHNPREAELAGQIHLVQGMASGDKMDWIIEKAVELGAWRVTPVAADFSVLQLRGERLERRVKHWQRVAQSASEQCGRNRVLVVDRPCTLAQFLEQTPTRPDDGALFCHPDYGTPLKQAVSQYLQRITKADTDHPPRLRLLVGPEGGWSDQELALAAQHNMLPVQFGTRVLRTETAGLALIAACTALLDWS